jgi:hypothetical protein
MMAHACSTPYAHTLIDMARRCFYTAAIHSKEELFGRHARVSSPYPPLCGGGALGVSGIQTPQGELCRRSAGFPLTTRGNDSSLISRSETHTTTKAHIVLRPYQADAVLPLYKAASESIADLNP